MASDNRFPRQLRLLCSSQYQKVFKEAQCRSSDKYLTLLACRNNKVHPRLGLAISKKHLKTAVLRHRVKRLIRESFRQNKKILGGLDIVVLGKSAANANNKVLADCLLRHWQVLVEKYKN